MSTKEWWYSHGYQALNEVLSGANKYCTSRLQDIGNIYLTNLIELPSGLDYKELAELISREGIPAINVGKDVMDYDIVLKI